jgi:hypothetical protein
MGTEMVVQDEHSNLNSKPQNVESHCDATSGKLHPQPQVTSYDQNASTLKIRQNVYTKHEKILGLDLGIIPKIAHWVHANILKSKNIPKSKHHFWSQAF